jgi:predicted PurR-regulated permease PerM
MQPPTAHRPLLKVSLIVMLLLLAFWVASQFPDLVLALIASGLAAFVLSPVVRWLEFRVGMKRTFAILSTFVVIGGAVLFIFLNLIPFLIDRARSIYTQLGSFPFDEKLTEAARGVEKSIPFISAAEVSKGIHAFISESLQQLSSVLQNSLATLVTLAIVPFVTYFVLAEGNTGLKKLIERVPNKYFEMALNVLHKIQRDLRGYLRGWILDSIIIGLVSMVGYSLIGVDYPILLGSIAGAANLIPYLGPVVGAIPAFLISLTQHGDMRLLIPIIIVTFLVQMIDNTLVQPFCYAKTVDMHPLTVILVLVVGNELMGVIGMLLAIPLFTIVKVTAIESYWGLKNYRITS